MNGTVAPPSNSATAASTCQRWASSSPAIAALIFPATSPAVWPAVGPAVCPAVSTVGVLTSALLGCALGVRQSWRGPDDDLHRQAADGDLIQNGPAWLGNVREGPDRQRGQPGQPAVGEHLGESA